MVSKFRTFRDRSLNIKDISIIYILIMSMDYEEEKISKSVRIPLSILRQIKQDVKEKKFKDFSEGVITLIQDGQQFKKIIAMIQDPKQTKKAIKQIKKIETLNDVKKTLKKFEPHELSLIAKIAKMMEEEKVQQTYLDMKG